MKRLTDTPPPETTRLTANPWAGAWANPSTDWRFRGHTDPGPIGDPAPPPVGDPPSPVHPQRDPEPAPDPKPDRGPEIPPPPAIPRQGFAPLGSNAA